jgi:hypothetical protein
MPVVATAGSVSLEAQSAAHAWQHKRLRSGHTALPEREKSVPQGHLIVAHYEVVGRVFSKATRPAGDDRLAACAREPVCKPRTEFRSSFQDGTIFNAGSHHFVVGYYQMSRRDEVLSECYFSLMLTA